MLKHYFKLEGEGAAGGGGGERNYAAEAAKMGHVPKEKWTGDPDKWVEPQEFVERAEQVLPIIRQQKRALEEEVRSLKAEQAQMKKDTVQFAEFVEGAAKREREALEAKLADALAERAEAVTSGDGVAFTKADKKVEDIKEEAVKAAKPNTPAPNKEEVHPDLADWLKNNPWYEANEEIRTEANLIATAMQVNAKKKGIDLNGKKLFDAVAAKMAKLYPEDVVLEETAQRSSVETGRDSEPPAGERPRRGGAKTYSNLPADAKATCERYIANAWIGKKKPEDFRKEFANAYQWD